MSKCYAKITLSAFYPAAIRLKKDAQFQKNLAFSRLIVAQFQKNPASSRLIIALEKSQESRIICFKSLFQPPAEILYTTKSSIRTTTKMEIYSQISISKNFTPKLSLFPPYLQYIQKNRSLATNSQFIITYFSSLFIA